MTFVSYLAGRVNTESEWEFIKNEAVVGNLGEDDLKVISDLVAKNLITFLTEHAQPFWKDKDIPANENTFGHPV